MITELVHNGVKFGTIGEPDDPRPPRVGTIIDGPGEILTIVQVRNNGAIAVVETFEF